MNTFFFPRLARLVVALGVTAVVLSESHAQAQGTYNWNTTAGTWDTSSANWSGSGSTWVNGSSNNAVFSNTATATTITLATGLQAGSVTVGNTSSNNANYTFSGGSLSASSFALQGNSGNSLNTGDYPTTTLSDIALTVSGSLTAGRAQLVIGGSSTVTAGGIGGPGGDGNGAWGQLTIQDTAVVAATSGITGGSTAWGLNLNGGTLITSGIDYGPHSFLSTTTNLNFNGTLVQANQNNSNFITASTGLDFLPVIQAGGARFDTNGFNIGVALPLSGTGGLTKLASGTLTLTGAANTFTGGVTVTGGALLLNKGIDVDSIAAGNAVVVNAGATIALGSNRGQINDGIASLTLNGGTFDLGDHIEGLNPAVTMNSGTVAGTSAGFLLARGGYAGTGASVISQRLSVRSVDANSGLFNITSGTTTVGGVIFSDDASAGAVTKSGVGTLVLNGPNTYTGATSINAGTLAVNGSLGTTAVSIASGATLGGSGSLAGPVNVLGTLSPGNSPGVITLGSLVLGGTSTTLIEITGTSRGTTYDGVDITTSSGLTYGGLLSLDFSTLISALANNTTLDIFNFSGTPSGDFSSVTSTGLYSGTWNSLGSGSFQLVSGPQTLTFSQATGDIIVVPEPTSLTLAALGLAAGVAIYRRRA